MSRRAIRALTALSLVLAALAGPRVTFAAKPDPTVLMQRVDRAMQHIRSFHTAGQHTSTDPSARLGVSIAGDCQSPETAAMPVLASAWVHGRYAEARKPARQVDVSYVLQGQTSPVAGHAWVRSAATHEIWIGESLDAGIDQAYARQICPALVRETYIHGYFLGGLGRTAQPEVVGRATVQGFSTWHVRRVLGFAIDLYVDAHTYQLRRMVLSGNIGTTWQQTFDYSAFNETVDVTSPGIGGK